MVDITVHYPDPLYLGVRKFFWNDKRDDLLKAYLGADPKMLAVYVGCTEWMVRSRLIKLGLRRPARNRRQDRRHD